MIERICETCRKPFQAKPYSVSKGQARFCSLKCYGASPQHFSISQAAGKYERTDKVRKVLAEKCHERFAGVPKSEEHKRKIGESNKGNRRPDLAAYVHRMAASGAWKGENSPSYGRRHTEKTKRKLKDSRLAYIARTPIEQRRLTDEAKTKISAVRKQQWQDPEYVARLIKAMGVKPNCLERRLIVLLEKHFPEYKYNGDFSQGVMLGGLTPDFVNVNGKKKVIEVFGDYWHSPELVGDDWRRGELGKIMIYNSVGWDCLVIWERELKEFTEEEIIEKISDFSKRRLKCPV